MNYDKFINSYVHIDFVYFRCFAVWVGTTVQITMKTGNLWSTLPATDRSDCPNTLHFFIVTLPIQL